MEDTPKEIACPSCAQPVLLSHCANCGEQRVDDHSWSLSHFFHDALHEFVHLASKIFGTFWNLFRRPGLLTAPNSLTPAEVMPVISERMGKIFSITQYLSACLFAVAPWLLFRRSRPWYLQHLIFLLHVYCFYYLFTSLTFQLLPTLTLARAPLVLVTVSYLFFAIRRLYNDAVWPAIGKALLLRMAHAMAEAVAIGIAVTGAFFWTARSMPH